MQTLYVKIPVKALTATKELKVSTELTQWVLDEPTNTLYAISETGRKLDFINAATMTVDKSLSFTGKPTDVIKENGKLYVAIDDIHQIVVVDMSSRTIIETINTSSDPYRIVKDGDKIYYTELDQWCDIYEYNLATNTEKMLSIGSISSPDIAINPTNHLLYLGESGSSGSDMVYYSTIDNKIVDQTSYDDGYGFPYPSRNTIFDGTNVYYAGRDFSAENPRRFNGDFGTGENVIYVNNGLVYTNKSIYDKDTHAKLGDYGYNASLVEASNNTLYIYNKDTESIKNFNDSNKLINSSNVIDVISGNHTLPVQTNTDSVRIDSVMNNLEMRSKLTQWVLDEATNTVFAISKDDKALFFINATNLNLEKSLTFASSPTDIIEDNGKVYVSLDDANEIAIVDIGSRTITGTLYTSSDPYRLVKDGDKIYYAERDQWCNIYEYNLLTNTDKKTSIELVYFPDLALNPVDHILYIGESRSSGSHMIYYSTTDNNVIGQSNYNSGYGFPSPSRITLFDGEKVYYAGFDFDKKNPTRILGSYDGEVIFAKHGVAITNTSVYDSKSYTLLQEYGGGIDLYEMSQQAVTYYYSEVEKAILRVDPSKISDHSVRFISNGGTEVQNQTVAYGNKVIKPEDPTRGGYTFGGWYTDQYPFTTMFGFDNTLLVGDINLYARWIPTEAYIISYLQQSKDTKLFGIYNQAKAVVYESDLSEAKKGYYLGELAKLDNEVFTDINKYFIDRCGAIAANPNLTDYLALVDEIDAKLTTDMDRGYFKGEMTSWGHYRVYTPEVQASISAIIQVWNVKTPESVTVAREAIAKVKEAGSITWLNSSLDEAVQAMSK
jgi:uncharacterized repeat protein (TIGR02543 family)